MLWFQLVFIKTNIHYLLNRIFCGPNILLRQKHIKSWPCEKKLYKSRYKIRGLSEKTKIKSRRVGFCSLGINRGERRVEDNRWCVSCCAEDEVNRGNMRK